MKTYRINCVDEHNKLVSAHDIMLADDLAALRKANEFCADSAVEVWDGERRVVWMKQGGEPRYATLLDAVAPPNSKSAQAQIDLDEAPACASA